MNSKYDNPNEISDEEIETVYQSVDQIRFSARPFNSIFYRKIAFGDLGWWLPLERVLPLIGITSQMLRPVFDTKQMLVKRKFPFNWSWFGLNKKCYDSVLIEIPEQIDRSEQLGILVLEKESFYKLADVLGKIIEVYKEDGGTGDHYHLYTIHPSNKTAV